MTEITFVVPMFLHGNLHCSFNRAVCESKKERFYQIWCVSLARRIARCMSLSIWKTRWNSRTNPRPRFWRLHRLFPPWAQHLNPREIPAIPTDSSISTAPNSSCGSTPLAVETALWPTVSDCMMMICSSPKWSGCSAEVMPSKISVQFATRRSTNRSTYIKEEALNGAYTLA
jgi:hypothetical protein